MNPRNPPVRRAVLVTATEPEPRSFGKQVVLGGLLDHLVDRLGADQVHVVVLSRSGGAGVPAPGYRIHRLSPPSAGEQVRALFTRVLGPARSSLQEAALHSRRVAAELELLLREIGADLEVWDTLRTAQYVAAGRPGAQRVLYADDLFSERYASLLALPGGLDPAANPLGEFLRFLPAPARPFLGRPAVYRPLLQLERRLLAGREVRMVEGFDRTLLVSPEETRVLAARAPGATVRTLPPALPRRAGDGREARSWDGAARFLFLGSLSFAPNRDGLTWFLTTCREEVLAAVPDFELHVVGRGNEVGSPAARAWGEHVRFHGFVDDLDGLVGASAAMLSPLRFGSGTKIKVLEALARGLPVVATPAGVHGVPNGRDHGSLVATGAGELAAALAAARDPEVNAALSRGARRTWRDGYGADVLATVYDDLLGTSGAPRRIVLPDPAGVTA